MACKRKLEDTLQRFDNAFDGRRGRNKGGRGRDTDVRSRDISVGGRDVSVGSRDVIVGSRDVSVGRRDVSAGSRDVSAGSRDVSVGSKDVNVGSSDVSVGSLDGSVGSRDVSVGSLDVSVGSRDVNVGSRDVSVCSRDVSVGSRDVSVGSRDASVGSRDASRSEGDTKSVRSNSPVPPTSKTRGASKTREISVASSTFTETYTIKLMPDDNLTSDTNSCNNRVDVAAADKVVADETRRRRSSLRLRTGYAKSAKKRSSSRHSTDPLIKRRCSARKVRRKQPLARLSSETPLKLTLAQRIGEGSNLSMSRSDRDAHLRSLQNIG